MRDPWILGGLVAEQPILVHAADLVIFVTRITGYPNGFSFCVHFELRSLPSHHAFQIDLSPVGEEWRVAPEVGFADGTRWRVVTHGGDGIVFESAEAGFGPLGGSYSATYWVPALPPAGPVEFTIRFDSADEHILASREGSAEVDGTLILRAARTAMELWPRTNE